MHYGRNPILHSGFRFTLLALVLDGFHRSDDYMEFRMSRHNEKRDESEINAVIPFPPRWVASNIALPDGISDERNDLPGFSVRMLETEGTTQRRVFTNWEARSTSPGTTHVLVMDDNLEILDILGQLLGDEAYDVALSSSPLGLEEIQDLQPDIIMLDATFNRLTTGPDLMDILREETRTKGIPLICTTILPHIAQNLADAGYTALLKPFDLDNVPDAVTVAIDQQRRI